MSNADLKEVATAIHEAGHAVAIHHLSPRYFTVDLHDREDDGMLLQRHLEFPKTLEECEQLVIQCLAGPKAEARHTRQSASASSRGWNNDIEQAQSMLDLIDRPDSINEYMEKARQFVIDHWTEVQRLADALMVHQSLDSFECSAIIDHDLEWFDELRSSTQQSASETVNRKSFLSDPIWPDLLPNTTPT